MLTLDGFNVTKNNVSIFYHIKPSNKLLGYFVSLRFGAYPVLNITAKLYDVSSIFCPNNLRTENNESFYVLFANISHTINYKGFVGAGYKELNTTEFQYFCTQQGPNSAYLDNINQRNLTANISVRVQLAGCYYLNKLTGVYSSYGLNILATTNTTHIQFESNHLGEFAGGWITVPNQIDFSFVFANSAFDKNITIYTTVIVLTVTYIVLLIILIQRDRKDDLKLKSIILPQCEPQDEFFYEINLKTESTKIKHLEVCFLLLKMSYFNF